MNGSRSNAFILGGSIILAGLLIAFGIYAVNQGDATPKNNDRGSAQELPKISLVTERDHIIGSMDASLILVEYSDTECPFCKNFHDVMNSLMEKYKDGNEVAWVYRHFPLTSIHPKAPKEAEATECAYEIGGNDGFWNYINRLYEITPSNNNLDLKVLPEIAEHVGLDKTLFEACLDNNTYKDFVKDAFDEAISVGANGTPFNVLILKKAMSEEVRSTLEEIQGQFQPGQLRISDDNTQVAISGGLSEEGIQSFIDLFLGKIE